MLYILYSNDYELYLGGNHLPEEEVLIAPTAQLLDVCGDTGVPMTLFADVACLWRYSELGYPGVQRASEAQMIAAVAAGHDVQTHLHPHWLHAGIERSPDGSSRYDADPETFLLGNASSDPQECYRQARELLSRAKAYLEALLRPHDPAYRCVAFRAGGYGIQPHTAAIAAALADTGYRVDSSVVPGMRLESNVNCIDFRDIPAGANFYLPRSDAPSDGTAFRIYEIPVASASGLRLAMTRHALVRLRHRLQTPPTTRVRARGYTIQVTDGSGPWRRRWRRLAGLAKPICHGWQPLELHYDVDVMMAVTRRFVESRDRTQRDLYFSFSCHGKCADAGMLDALRRYHALLKHAYGEQVQAITFQAAVAQIEAAERAGQSHREPIGAVLDVP